MIPTAFAYEAPESLDEAIRLLREDGQDAKVLAGGHSLLPMMKLRFAAPALLVDLRRIPGLHGIQRENGSWRIGALVPIADLEDTPELGVVALAAGKVADRQVRNRGTIGGTLAHADPGSDLPTVLLTCDGSVTLQGADGQRVVGAGELFRGYMQTARTRSSPRCGSRPWTVTGSRTRSSPAAPRTGRWWRCAPS
jgi:carbon-monoxide dehydrogenase medium subunit